MAKKKNPFKENKYEIYYNFINAGIAGALVLVGSVIDGSVTRVGIFASLMAALLVLLLKFQNYWKGEKSEYTTKLVKFI